MHDAIRTGSYHILKAGYKSTLLPAQLFFLDEDMSRQKLPEQLFFLEEI
jgi:hypothetical protein